MSYEFEFVPSPFLPPLDLDAEPRSSLFPTADEPLELTPQTHELLVAAQDDLDAFAVHLRRHAKSAYDERLGAPGYELAEYVMVLAHGYAQIGEVELAIHMLDRTACWPDTGLSGYAYQHLAEGAIAHQKSDIALAVLVDNQRFFFSSNHAGAEEALTAGAHSIAVKNLALLWLKAAAPMHVHTMDPVMPPALTARYHELLETNLQAFEQAHVAQPPGPTTHFIAGAPSFIYNDLWGMRQVHAAFGKAGAATIADRLAACDPDLAQD